VPLGEVEVGRVVRVVGAPEAPGVVPATDAPLEAAAAGDPMTIVSSSGVAGWAGAGAEAGFGAGRDVPLVPVLVDRRFDLLNVWLREDRTGGEGGPARMARTTDPPRGSRRWAKGSVPVPRSPPGG